MTTFLTLAVYSLRVSADLPVQSEYFPLISVYFFIGLLLTFISLVWFVVANSFNVNQHVPYILEKMTGVFLKKIEPEVNSRQHIENVVKILNKMVLYLLGSIMFISYIIIWLLISLN